MGKVLRREKYARRLTVNSDNATENVPARLFLPAYAKPNGAFHRHRVEDGGPMLEQFLIRNFREARGQISLADFVRDYLKNCFHESCKWSDDTIRQFLRRRYRLTSRAGATFICGIVARERQPVSPMPTGNSACGSLIGRNEQSARGWNKIHLSRAEKLAIIKEQY